MEFLHSLLPTIAFLTAQATSLQTAPTGEYYYEQTGAGRPQHVLLRKVGRTVIGVNLPAIGEPMCFRGWLEGDTVVNATWMLPPYNPAARLSHETGVLLDLTSYQSTSDTPSDRDQATLRSCVNFFWR